MTAVTVVVMDVDAARRLTERIRLTAHTARESIEQLQVLVEQARDGEAHLALGYASWPAYLADVLGDEPLRLPRDQRQELVGYLSGEGMSTRAIAPIVGASQSTVLSDVRSTEQNRSVDPPATVTSLDGRQRPATQPATVQVQHDESGHLRDQSPRAERRASLPAQARTAGWDLRKAVERVERIADDDRFDANKEQVASHLRGHLSNAVEVCQDLLTRLTHEGV